MATATMEPDTTPLTVNAAGAARRLGIGKTLFLEMDRDGRLGPECIRFGSARRWDPVELDAWFRARRPRREAWVKIREQKGR